MRALTAAATLGVALLAPTLGTGPATAAGETCRGEAATVVGANGDPIVGTAGRDVVVTNGVMSVRTLGGDDLVCITGQPLLAMTVESGDGDDVVDASTGGRLVDLVDLGTGSDTYIGTEGDDRVTSDVTDGASPDVIEGRGGTDTVLLDGGQSDLAIDNRTGRLMIAGQVRATWTGIEEFRLQRSGTRTVAFVGSDADEAVFDSGSGDTLADVDLGQGRDSYHVDVAPLEGSRLRGGGGRDLIEVSSEATGLDLDLKRHRMIVDAATSYYVSTPDFEDAIVSAPEVRIKGDETANRLGFAACNAVVKGREGKDEIRWASSPFAFALDCAESARIDGGPGHDELSGTRGDDTILGNDGHDVLSGIAGDDKLFGGRGKDEADGGGGRDRCVAEKKVRCER